MAKDLGGLDTWIEFFRIDSLRRKKCEKRRERKRGRTEEGKKRAYLKIVIAFSVLPGR